MAEPAQPHTPSPKPVVRQLGRRAYTPTWQAMRDFTEQRRGKDQADEFWLLEHESVYTQGSNGQAEHLLMPGDIPVVQSDRGGQITYHGPGQIMLYVLVDITRLGLGVRSLVSALENGMIATLASYDIQAQARRDAPGVYVDGAKIGSIGLRIRHGFSYHGLALNVDMDLEPFSRINPCGFQGLSMTQIADFASSMNGPVSLSEVSQQLLQSTAQALGIASIEPADWRHAS